MIGLLLVEDHVSFRQSLALNFTHEPDFAIVAQAGSLGEARGKLQEKLEEIDVAIVDIDLPDGIGVDLIRDLHRRNRACKVLVLSGSASETQLAEAVEAGAAGVLHKAAPLDEVIDAARRLGAGQSLLTPEETIQMLREAGRHREQNREAQQRLASLTPREREVLRALVDAPNDKDLARRLRISVDTVHNHVARILDKLGVQSRLQALVFAVRHGAVTID